YLGREPMEKYDPDLFHKMKELEPLKSEKDIKMVEDSGLFPDLTFHDKLLNTDALPLKARAAERTRWHQAALEQLKDAELVFADPDNGLIKVDKEDEGKAVKKGSQKYIFSTEIEDYFKRGQNIVYYHHRPRKKEDAWLKDKRIMAGLPGAKLLAVSAHRWVNRAYIFVVHEDQYEFYKKVIDGFLQSDWGTVRVDKKLFFTSEDV
nr:hypothetical protein [Lachnospiraceae bacterium]